MALAAGDLDRCRGRLRGAVCASAWQRPDSVDSVQPAGPPLFGGTLLFVLGLALLVVPALTAQSVNGDRERGTLATLQVTRLSAAEIGLGKLAAAWGAALIFLALTLPVIVWAMIEGGLPFVNVVVTPAVVALLLGVVCAVSQAWSALFARSITSAWCPISPSSR